MEVKSMGQFINFALTQINSKVGDIEGNLEKIIKFWSSLDKESDIILFPELALSGSPPEDLLLRHDFIQQCHKALEALLNLSNNLHALAVIGMPYYDGALYNALVVLGKGKVWGIYKKAFLFNYSVFDEKRYFKAGKEPFIFEFNGSKIGFSIGEDLWQKEEWRKKYISFGCEILITINASPFYIGKYQITENLLKAFAKDYRAYVVYVNMVGAQDELIFDGRSMVIHPEGQILARAKAFEEDTLLVRLDMDWIRRKRLDDLSLSKKELERFSAKMEENPKEEEELYKAITFALRDYVEKNSFEKVVLGLSGGMDSSLVACLAVDALGKERVVGVFMPSKYTSKESKEDVKDLVKNLEIKCLEYPITPIYEVYLRELGSKELTVAEENLQARIRANILFYLSNLYGWLVLSTSNKSESAVGYGTIYGDMAGGYAPLKDLYKTWVYKLARYRNSIKPDIPERVFSKAPSAELRPKQTDQDTLPPYELLDNILNLYIEEGLSFEEILAKDFAANIVKKVIEMVKRAEYKRKQTPIGPKLTKRAFGKDWRMPITNGFLPLP